MKVIRILNILIFAFSSILFCQSNGNNICWFPADYFIGENAIVSQKIIFKDKLLIPIFNDFKRDTLKSKITINLNDSLDVSNCFVEVNPGYAIMNISKDYECWLFDDELHDTLFMSKNDTIKYFGYLGEAHHLIGREDIMTQIENWEQEVFSIIKENKIISKSVYLPKYNGWIEFNEDKMELKTIWAKYY